jgi:Tfp pilus assembly protein PilF
MRKLLTAGLAIVALAAFVALRTEMRPRPPRLQRTVVEPPEPDTFVWETEPSIDEEYVEALPPPPLGERAAALNNEAVGLGNVGRYEEAERLLEQALELDPAHPTLLRNLQATLFNWGVTEMNAGDAESAIDRLEDSLRAGSSVEALKILGSAYLQVGEPREAAAALEEAAGFAPSNPQILVLLAQSYVDLDRRLEALELLFRARDAGAPEGVVGPMITTLSREVDAEWDFAAAETAHFRVSFGDEELPDTVDIVGDALERAYRTVGGKLGSYPADRTPVVLYARQDFHSLTQTSQWAEGVFDGRIKIPVRGLDAQNPKLDRVLRHEYAHSLVARLGGRRVPAWVNEGVAMWAEEEYEGDRLDWAERIVSQHGAAPLRYLEQSFARMPAAQAQLAYAQSYVAIHALIDRYGSGRLRQLLDEIARKRPLAEAFYDVYRLDLERFEHQLFAAAAD